MESKESSREELSSAKAVLVGALAPGVTLCWTLAFSSSDFSLTLHVAFLILITGIVFVLVTRFLAETGFVVIEHQMEQIGLAPRDEDTRKKTS